MVQRWLALIAAACSRVTAYTCKHLLRGIIILVGCAALQSAATAFTLSCVAMQGKPHWHTRLILSMGTSLI